MSSSSRKHMSRTLVLIIIFLCSILVTSLMETIYLKEIFQVEKTQFLFNQHDDQETSLSLNVKTYRSVLMRNYPLPLVLLIHGFSSSSQVMEPLALHLAQKGFFVVSYDLPGHGKSEGIFNLEESQYLLLELALQARRVVDFVMEKVGKDLVISEIAVVGHSLGANVALMLGALDPELVRTVVAIGLLDLALPREQVLNTTIPRNVLVISGSLDQLVDEQVTLKYVNIMFPNGTFEGQERQEWGDIQTGTGRKYQTVFSDHVLLVFHPEVYKLTREWIARSFSCAPLSSSDELVGLILVGIYNFVSFVKFITVILLLVIISLFLDLKMFRNGRVSVIAKSNVMEGKEKRMRYEIKKRHRTFLLTIFFVEMISFTLSIAFTYFFMLVLTPLKIKLVLMAFVSIFWASFSVLFLFGATLLLNNSLAKHVVVSLCKKLGFWMITGRSVILDTLMIFLVLSVTLIGIEIAISLTNLNIFVVSIQLFPIERLISFFLIMVFMHVHLRLLDFFIGSFLFEGEEKINLFMWTTGLLALSLFSIGLLTVIIPSTLLPSPNKAGVLFFAATNIFSLSMGFIVAVIFIVLIKKILFILSFRKSVDFFHQISVFLLSLTHSLVLVSLYPLLG